MLIFWKHILKDENINQKKYKSRKLKIMNFWNQIWKLKYIKFGDIETEKQKFRQHKNLFL